LDSIETDVSLLVENFAKLEDDQECDEAAVLNLLINDTELAQLLGWLTKPSKTLNSRLWSLAARKMPISFQCLLSGVRR
jgi:hypothetical protein